MMPQKLDLPLDSHRALKLVMQLMAIPGTSGQEAQVAGLVRETLLDAGAPASRIRADAAHRRTRLRGQTGNLCLQLPGTLRAPRRLLSAHMDTVPICVGSRPVLRGGQIRAADASTGLGADDRAGVAVILTAARTILEQRLPHPPLTFLWTVQEEVGLQGIRHVSRSLLGRPGLAFNWDGGAPHKLTVGATGGYRMALHVHGIASHAGGAPEHGVSAITICALAIAQLHRTGWLGDVRKGAQCGTSNVGVIQGGAATNVVTDCVRVLAEARSHDPGFRQKIVNRIEQQFHHACGQVRNVAGRQGRLTLEGHLDYEAFILDPQHPCVQTAQAAVERVGCLAQLAVANGGVDANWLNQFGIPTVTLGCGQRLQHTVEEALDVAEFQRACRIALHLATAAEQ